MPSQRLIVHLVAQKSCDYDSAYHRKLRGYFLRHLPDEYIPNSDSPIGICFSGLIPWGNIEDQDRRKIIVSATNQEILSHLVGSLQEDRLAHIGEMKFKVEYVETGEADVGLPGTKGTIETDTGILLSFDPDEAVEHGISYPGEGNHYWGSSDPLTAFKSRLEENIETTWNHLTDADQRGPEDLDRPVFNSYNFLKDFSIPLRVAEDHTETVLLSKWRLGYEVRSETHREVLNHALAAGLGEKNSYGLGATSIVEKQEPFLAGV